MKRFLVFLILSLIILDRFSKWLILNCPDLYQGGLIELKLFKNPNLYFISFNSTPLYFLIGVVMLLLLFLFFRSWQRKDFLLLVGFSLIILGGLSNLLDRIIFGYVIDWLRVFFLPISIFNIADLMIVGGIITLIGILIKNCYNKSKVGKIVK
ncbi:MAG: signal peptidase II [Candidatus Portnoybacteria bacterium]|nr:signal peptidase II [Candidatus Portnoybacteria bacterium]